MTKMTCSRKPSSTTRILPSTLPPQFAFPFEIKRPLILVALLHNFFHGCSTAVRSCTHKHPPPSGFSAGYIAVQILDTDGVISATCQMKLTLPTRLDNIIELCVRVCTLSFLKEGDHSPWFKLLKTV